MTDLSSLLESKARIASEELQLVRSALRHGGQKGSALEQSVIALLSDHLPDRLGVTEGVVATSTGYLSPQLDIIIYDKAAAQILYRNATTRVIPIEYVFAVGEVKAKLSLAGFNRFFAIQRELKSHPKFLMPAPVTYHAYGANWSAPPIASFIFALEGGFSPLHASYIKQHLSNPINLCVDTVVCPTKFIFYRSGEYGADLYLGNRFKLNGVRKHCLFLFLGMIAKASSDWFLRQSPQIYRYYSGVQGIPNSKITTATLLPPTHPDIIAGGK